MWIVFLSYAIKAHTPVRIAWLPYALYWEENFLMLYFRYIFWIFKLNIHASWNARSIVNISMKASYIYKQPFVFVKYWKSPLKTRRERLLLFSPKSHVIAIHWLAGWLGQHTMDDVWLVPQCWCIDESSRLLASERITIRFSRKRSVFMCHVRWCTLVLTYKKFKKQKSISISFSHH